MFRRGCLYWGSLDKRRPVLVVSSQRFNLRSGYVTVVPGSTRLRPMVAHVRLRKGEGGAPRPTMLLCEHVQTVPKCELEPEPLGARISAVRMGEVERAILVVLGIELLD